MDVQIDHLIYAATDLKRGIQEIEDLLQMKVSPGGRHPDWGTRNALLRLGEEIYLEVIGPDPEANTKELPALFHINELSASRLVTWAARKRDLYSFCHQLSQNGIELGYISEGNRALPDGTLLSWQLTSPFSMIGDGIVPFLIDWQGVPNPATALEPVCTLQRMWVEHPEVELYASYFEKMKLPVPLKEGPEATVKAIIKRVDGKLVELG